MNKYEILTNKGPLDTYGSDSLSFNYSIKDILDITTRTNGYSKTISLPGTPTNNEFFAFIYDVNIDNITFNPLKRIQVTVSIDGNIIINGYMQLLNIQNINGNISYDVTIFGTLKNLITSFGDNVLTSLSLKEYNHTRNQTTIKNSWEYKVPVNGTITNFGKAGDGFVYPYIINGNSQDIKDNLYVYDLNPAIYARTIMQKLISYGGYSYTSNFLDSDYYRNIIIPYVGDAIQMTVENKDERIVCVGIVENVYPEYGDATQYTYNGSDWIHNSDIQNYIGLSRESGTVTENGSDLTFRDDLNQYNTSLSVLTIAKTGRYDVSFYGNAFLQVKNDATAEIEFKGGSLSYAARMILVKANGSTQILDDTGAVNFQPNSNNYKQSPYIYEDTAYIIELLGQNVLLEVGDRIVIGLDTVHPKNVNWKGINDKMIATRLLWKRSYNDIYTKLQLKSSVNESYGNDSIDMAQILNGTMKMKDFFLDQCKMFNLVVMDDPNKANNLLIEPEEDFYITKQKVKDWEDKLDYDNIVKITPMSEVNAKSFKFTYAEDDDYFNKAYTDETKRVFGDFEVEIDNDFSDSKQTIQLGFACTPCGNLDISEGNRYAPFFINNDIKDGLKSKKVKPRILFYNGLKALESNKHIALKDYPAATTSSSLTKLPMCSMWDDIFNPINSLEFGRLSKVYFENKGISPNQNLFEKFYKSSLLNITDLNAKLFEGKFVLTPKDIAEFDFRDIILLQGSYWRVNEIKDYNPIEGNELTTVILYKIMNLDILSKYQVVMPKANKSCPTDIAIKRVNFSTSVYYSQSGGIITADCCKQLAGSFRNGVCNVGYWVREERNPHDLETVLTEAGGTGFRWERGDIEGTPWWGGIKKVNGGWGTVPIEEKDGPYNRNEWNNTRNAISNSKIFGRENYIHRDVENAFVVGNNNSVLTAARNSQVFGNNIIADEADTMYLGANKIGSDGILRHSGEYIIDGGLDEVFNVNKTNPIEVIDGTIDSVRNIGGDSWSRFVIDASGKNNRTIRES